MKHDRLPPKLRFVRFWQGFLCAALLVSLLPTNLLAAPRQAENAPLACPAAPASLPDVIERATFCVYYNDADTTDAQATTIADHTQSYWDRYVTDFGFQAPAFTGKLEVQIVNSASCNGGTSSSSNVFTVNNGCFAIAESAQQTPGHELFHRVQYSYDGVEVRWFKEGTARAIEDLAFTNIDHWINALMAPFNVNLQHNEYLNNTNVDITSDPQRYNSALWWKYFTEQFGTTVTEPQRGVDALVTLWQAAATQDDIAALNTALGNLGAGMNFDAAFRRFAAANWIKDLTNQPSAAYNYLDEDEVGNPAAYGPIIPTSGGTISTGTPANFSNQALSRYGARYYRAIPSATNCPVVSARFHTDSGPAFYHVITQKGAAAPFALDSYGQSTATDWTRAFFNDGLTAIVAIAGSTNAAAQADITLECVNPVLDVKLPNSGAVANVGPFNAPGKLLVQALVTNGDPKGPVVAGLTVNDFKVRVNGENALITTGGFIQQQYWLVVQAPNQLADGVYDLEVSLEKSGSTTVLATDTNSASVSYNANNMDQVLVLDRSGSMTGENRIEAARQAAKFYVDITRNNDGLAVVAYNENVNPAPFAIRPVTAVPNVRQQAKDYLDTISASGLTSIGDGMAEAVNQRNASPTGNTPCSYVLLSDGMENSAQFWASVQASVVGTGCPVTSIAFGPESDETLMQNIATATGGLFFYNDVYVSQVAAAGVEAIDAASDTALDLGSTYEYAEANQEGRQRILAEKDLLPFGVTGVISQVHPVVVDDSVSEMLFALDWPNRQSFLELKLRKPDGTLIDSNTLPYTFSDFGSGHVGWRIANPDPGTWQMIVTFAPFIPFAPTAASAQQAMSPSGERGAPYQVIASGKSNLMFHLLLPDRLGSRYFTGNRVPIYAFLSGNGPLGNFRPVALVTAPNGVVSRVPLFDDGQHGDGEPGDGFYAGQYTLVNQAVAVTPQGEDTQQPTPKNEGSYRVRLLVQTPQFVREALGSFSVQAGSDTNGNGLPDPFEEENQVTQDGGDPDLDSLDNLSEYQLGTDPNNSDTDGGGENDGSEFAKGKDPFDPTDDGIVAPQFLHVTPNVGMNVVSYDVRPEYNRMVLYRATNSAGPWSIQQPELPNTGVYSDTATNGVNYFYRYMAIDADDDRSAVIDTSPATPSQDPFRPEARVEIDGNAIETLDRDVILTFVPSNEEGEFFDDITQMKLSNDPQLTGASYQPFAQNVPWQLAPTAPGEVAKVYAQFRDGAGNESLITLSGIRLAVDGSTFSHQLYLPLIAQ
ncbi:MAG: VWA domain-containing protein [Caldilineaceae bacterium]|nr:VWA domain-containing protein [Caldilineaceae bacterium]